MERTNGGWVRFWEHGTWWKALMLVAVYWGVFQLISLGVTTVLADLVVADDPLSTPGSVLVAGALPILIAGALVLFFARTVGWLGDIFGPQPVRARPWMWVAVALVLVPMVMRVLAIGWSAYSGTFIASILVLGLCVGFTEELLTRGVVVRMLRGGGYREHVVFALSALYFALLHSGNFVSGQPLKIVAATVVYTFGFGAMMYLSMRVTGRLYWAMLLHAATDPITILATGTVDGHAIASTGESSVLVVVAGVFNFVYVFIALIAIFLVKRLEQTRALAAKSS